MRHRAGLAEAADRAIDDVGTRPAHRLIVEAEALHRPGPEILDEDVAGPRQREASSRPSAVCRSSATERLLRLKPMKVGPALPAKGGPQKRVSSPTSGISSLMTSAPRSPSTMVQSGPASARVASSTRMPDKGPPVMAPPPRIPAATARVRARGNRPSPARRLRSAPDGISRVNKCTPSSSRTTPTIYGAAAAKTAYRARGAPR